jgi:hypothetical protein
MEDQSFAQFDKSFAQSIEELNQRATKDITDEALRCWAAIQQGTTVANATAHLGNEHMRDAVTHLLFYVLLQSLLFEAQHRQIITAKRYEELRTYMDSLTREVKKQPLMVLPIVTS